MSASVFQNLRWLHSIFGEYPRFVHISGIDRSSLSGCGAEYAPQPDNALTATKLAVDLANFLDPALPVEVLQGKDFIHRPVEVVGDVGYLLVKAL